MRKTIFILAAAVVASAWAAGDDQPASRPADSRRAEEFTALCAALAARAQAADTMTVAGADGWLFLAGELKFLAVGRFWGDRAKVVSRANDRESADPLPAIIDFKKQLDKLGIELIVVPVPPKAAIYPDKLPAASGGAQAFPAAGAVRYDPALAEFHKVLAENGVRTLDLSAAMLKARAADAAEGPVFCRTDTHWTPRGCRIAADAIAGQIRLCRWYKKPDKAVFASTRQAVEIVGDLVDNPAGAKKETIDLLCVGVERQGKLEPLKADAKSPILLMGDSMCLVWNMFLPGEQDQTTQPRGLRPSTRPAGAGLADLLALELQTPVDLLAAMGGGATQAREDLADRAKADRQYLAGKKIVIWCFAARAFTLSFDGWRISPLNR
ncbi:MAG: hypothetical protein HZA50_06105 [Planctomycetes bacterium]|nr:hypothetical protein [Planctomycetota bacterium]